MIIDRQLRFSNSQAITASAASEDLIDLAAARNMGVGKTIYVVVVCTVAMTDSGSDSTVAVTVQTDTAAAFGSATTAQTIGTFAATSAAGTRFIVPLAHFTTAEQFVRLYYTVAGGNLTTGSFTAFLTTEVDAFTAYPDNITITH